MNAYLKPGELRDGFLYRIDAMRANYGIWLASSGSFLISREKFGHVYLFEEILDDREEPFQRTARPFKELERATPFSIEDFSKGTAKPIEELEQAPFPVERLEVSHRKKDEEVLKYLSDKEDREPIREQKHYAGTILRQSSYYNAAAE